MNSAIIVAGGKSSRINCSTPKQFISINGKEILNYSVTTFLKHPKINEVIIVCRKEWINHVKSHYKKCKIISFPYIYNNAIWIFDKEGISRQIFKKLFVLTPGISKGY